MPSKIATPAPSATSINVVVVYNEETVSTAMSRVSNKARPPLCGRKRKYDEMECLNQYISKICLTA